MKKIKQLTIAILCVCLFASVSYANKDDIVILYTNDVHSHIDTNIGYAGAAAMKRQLAADNTPVALVDCGDILQGDLLCTVSQGEIPMKLFDMTGYDFFTLGNHEFDYGTKRLRELLDKTDAVCVNCNIVYFGADKSFMEKVTPYQIKSLGGKRIAFIGVTTPNTINSVMRGTFLENGKTAYDFFGGRHASDEALAKTVQKYVNECRRQGADYVLLLCHLGDSGEKYSSRQLIKNSFGIDAVLDGHDHHVIRGDVCKNKDGKDVLLTSTGAYFENIGKLTINNNGKISTELISKYAQKQPEIVAEAAAQREKNGKTLSEKIGFTDFALPAVSPNGARTVRCRETGLGNFCADAVAQAAGCEIAFVNGGAIRASIANGVITYGDLLSVTPFTNRLETAEIKGADLFDALEFSCAATEKESEANGNAVGEFGGFLSVHGLSFCVDTSIPSPVKVNERRDFTGISGERRVSDVWLTDSNGKKIEKILPDKIYTLANTDFLQNGGNGYTMFKKCRSVRKTNTMLFEALCDAIKNSPNSKIPERYQKSEGRIKVK